MTGRPANSRIATGSNAMSNPFSLEGKVALVTGANTGLGQGIAVALAEAGADIAAAAGAAAFVAFVPAFRS